MLETQAQFERALGRTLVVVAHPDDETIGCGLLLQRLKAPTVAFLTDGAPTDPYFWGKFGSRKEYARLRAAESQRALSTLPGVKRISYAARDQELMFHLDEALQWLRKAVAKHKPESIVTHAYEGGHPDHDCCSFLCWMAGGEVEVPVWEMPLYCRIRGKLTRQEALSEESRHRQITLTPRAAELRRKQEMISAYASQTEFLKSFDPSAEMFYPQADRDFLAPPHPGRLNYECWGWEITGRDVCKAFERTLHQERLQRAKTA